MCAFKYSVELKTILFYIFLSLSFVCLAQQTESEKLLGQAEKLVYSDPAEAKRISEHNLKISTNEKEIIKSYYIQAVSFYIMGEYSQSLESAFMSKNRATDLGDQEGKAKANNLIYRTLRSLQLHVPNENFVEERKDSEPAFQAEDLFQKANLSLLRNRTDSAIFYKNEAKSVMNLKESAWANLLYLKLKGDVFFKELKLDSAVIKIIFYIRNRNKLKMYRNMLEYLHRQKLPEPILNSTEEKPETPKLPTILKESENQILADLEKFEAGKKFTHKDMSLGMLAAQLNTNTKYLSEVINRQKQKNFNSYINELRINYITEKIKSDSGYLNYKVSYLAEECGFSSHSTFTTVFKSIVGVSPIMFVEFVRDELKREKSEPIYHA